MGRTQTLMVTGSRGITYRPLVWQCLTFACTVWDLWDDELGYFPVGIGRFIHGGAEGVDRIADTWAVNAWIPAVDEFEPDWDTYGKAAGLQGRSATEKMVKQADLVVGIWDGESRGTEGTLSMAWDYGKNTLIFIPSDTECTVNHWDPPHTYRIGMLDTAVDFRDQLDALYCIGADAARSVLSRPD